MHQGGLGSIAGLLYATAYDLKGMKGPGPAKQAETEPFMSSSTNSHEVNSLLRLQKRMTAPMLSL
jgi:hypothetical protein